jgi:hypothetical protein
MEGRANPNPQIFQNPNPQPNPQTGKGQNLPVRIVPGFAGWDFRREQLKTQHLSKQNPKQQPNTQHTLFCM